MVGENSEIRKNNQIFVSTLSTTNEKMLYVANNISNRSAESVSSSSLFSFVTKCDNKSRVENISQEPK